MDLVNWPVWAGMLFVALAQVSVVSLTTVRTILLVKGLPWVAALLGFFEVGIWMLAASAVLQNLHLWYLAAAYATGFALGNIGMSA